VIRRFRSRETARIFRGGNSRRLPAGLQRVAQRKLVMLDAAQDLHDLRVPPGNRRERLSGDRAGQYSIRIDDRWRICVVWAAGHAHDVEIVDLPLRRA
jgi:proteic killer suppression protein